MRAFGPDSAIVVSAIDIVQFLVGGDVALAEDGVDAGDVLLHRRT